MTTILKTLGDDWHTTHPYLNLIGKVIPGCEHTLAIAIEQKLIEVYVQEQNGFKIYKDSSVTTIYDQEIDIAIGKKKRLEEEKKKEEDRFNKLVEKFKEQDAPETNAEEEGEEDEEEEKDDSLIVKQKGKGQQACRRTLKKEQQHKKSLENSVKSSMATSQVRLVEFGEEIEKLEKICEYYTHYRKASHYYILAIRKLALAYSETSDIALLIQGLAELIPYYENMMRRHVPSSRCQGHEKGMCEIHLLPLCLTVYPSEGFKHVLTCAVSP